MVVRQLKLVLRGMGFRNKITLVCIEGGKQGRIEPLIEE